METSREGGVSAFPVPASSPLACDSYFTPHPGLPALKRRALLTNTGPLRLGQPLPRGLRDVHRYGFAPVISGECASVGGVYDFEFLGGDAGMLFYGNGLSKLDLRDAKYSIMVLAVATVKKHIMNPRTQEGMYYPSCATWGSVRDDPSLRSYCSIFYIFLVETA
jgi:hypothetical protein